MAEETPRAGDPVPSGVCQVTEKMEKRTCALCPKGQEWSVMYFAPSENIAAHENCLLYSSALVECEAHDNLNKSRNFAVKSVKKEIWRGRRLEQVLTQYDLFFYRNAHNVLKEEPPWDVIYQPVPRITTFPVAKEVNAVLQVDEVEGTYKLFCQKHAPELPGTSQSAESPSLQKRTAKKKCLPSGSPEQPPKKFKRRMRKEPGSHRDATAKVPFLKKCKEAGLLTELFEGILEKLDSIQGKLLSETASESDYEEIDTLLFDSGLFEDTLIKFQEVIKSKACEHEQRQRLLKEQLEALGNLTQTLCSFQENGDLNYSSSTSGSSLFP